MKLPKSFSGDKDGDKHLEKILDPSESKGENRLVYIEMVDSELYETINEAYKEFKAATGSPKAILSHYPGEPGAYLFMKESEREVFTGILDKRNIEYSVHEQPEGILKELSLADWKYIQMDEELFSKKEFPEPEYEEDQEDGCDSCGPQDGEDPETGCPDCNEEQEMVDCGPKLKIPAKYVKRLPGNSEEDSSEVPDYPDDAQKPKS